MHGSQIKRCSFALINAAQLNITLSEPIKAIGQNMKMRDQSTANRSPSTPVQQCDWSACKPVWTSTWRLFNGCCCCCCWPPSVSPLLLWHDSFKLKIISLHKQDVMHLWVCFKPTSLNSDSCLCSSYSWRWTSSQDCLNTVERCGCLKIHLLQ